MKCPFLFGLLTSVLADVHVDDLKRARTKKPRSGYIGKGSSLIAANEKLNGHLYAMDGVAFKDCDKFTTVELRDLLKKMHPYTSTELKEVYVTTSDARQSAYNSIDEMEEHWSQLDEIDDRVRDGHCHEAVMWFVHHLPKKTQSVVAEQLLLPKLPKTDHRVKQRDAKDAAGKFYDSKVSCEACHSGGLDNPFPNDLGPPVEGSLDRSRRCYTQYKEMYNITCGPCDGIAGPYWGDDTTKYYDPPTCVEVGGPDDIPESERVPMKIPEMFAVDILGGSDRWGRTTNPLDPDITPFSAYQNHMYGQIRGSWYLRAPADEDRWMLRHDTYYGNIAWNGSWDEDQSKFFNLTQIHIQSRLQASQGNTGMMVSLNRSGVWPIGSTTSTDPMCVCIHDPVGFPDVTSTRTSGLQHMTYLGRLKLAPMEFMGRTVEVDHYANWFFHVMMEVNSSSPVYGKAPIRLASAYAGTAVYGNWRLQDPNITHPGIFSADVPTTKDASGAFCLNPTVIDECKSVKVKDDEDGPANFPPPSSGKGDKCADHPGCANLTPLDGLCCPVANGVRLACCDDPLHPATCEQVEEEAGINGFCDSPAFAV